MKKMGRRKSTLRLRLEDLLERYPERIARDITCFEHIIGLFNENPSMTEEEYQRNLKNIRNSIRVALHKKRIEGRE